MTYGYDYEVLPSAIGNTSGWCEPVYARCADIQNHLKRLGYYSGPIDGVWGTNTVKGIQRVAQAKGQYSSGIDGIVGKGTVLGVGRTAAQQYASMHGWTTTWAVNADTYALNGNGSWYWDYFAIACATL